MCQEAEPVWALEYTSWQWHHRPPFQPHPYHHVPRSACRHFSSPPDLHHYHRPLGTILYIHHHQCWTVFTYLCEDTAGRYFTVFHCYSQTFVSRTV